MTSDREDAIVQGSRDSYLRRLVNEKLELTKFGLYREDLASHKELEDLLTFHRDLEISRTLKKLNNSVSSVNSKNLGFCMYPDFPLADDVGYNSENQFIFVGSNELGKKYQKGIEFTNTNNSYYHLYKDENNHWVKKFQWEIEVDNQSLEDLSNEIQDVLTDSSKIIHDLKNELQSKYGFSYSQTLEFLKSRKECLSLHDEIKSLVESNNLLEDDVDVFCNGYDLRYVTKFDYYVGSPYFDDSKGWAVLKYDNKILLHGKYSVDYNKNHAVVVDDLIVKSKQRAIKNHVTNLMYSKSELIDPLIDNLYALNQRSRPFDIVGSERREIINDLTSRFEVTKPNKEFIVTPKPVKRKSLIVNRYKTVRLLHKIDEYVS